MAWPTVHDYFEAVQNPSRCFLDGELQRGEPARNGQGLPILYAGNFASVFQINLSAGQRSYAIKCFTRKSSRRQERYRHISAHLSQAAVPFPHTPGKPLQAEVTIEANGNQRCVVRVNLTVGGKPRSTREAMVPAPPASVPPVVPADHGPIVSSSGRRLTTLVRDAVEAAVSKTVPLRNGINELMVLSLTLGLIGWAITWPFGLGRFGIFLGLAGLAAASAALGLLAKRKGTGYGLPALGALINAQALVMALILTWFPPKPAPTPPNFPGIAELHAGLSSPDTAKKAEAIAAVAELARGLETTRVDLLVALRDPDAAVRAAAADTLGRLGSSARVTFPVLRHVEKADPSENVRRQAHHALKKIGPPNLADLSEFLIALKDPDAGLRSAAAQALGLIGPDARDAVPPLEKALGDPDVGVSAAQALWEILADRAKDRAKGLVPVLVKGLKDKDRNDVRAQAAAALGTMHAADSEVLEALEVAMADEDHNVRIEAAMSLRSIGAPSSMPIFNKALADPQIKVRMVAAEALWFTAKDTKGIPALIDALGHSDSDTRVNAAAALEKFGPEARAAVPALSSALKDKNATVSARACDALYNIGPDALPAAPALREALQSSDPSMCSRAAKGMGGLGTTAREVLPDLRKALKDPNAEVRLSAVPGVWAMDPQIDEVRQVITRVLNEEKKDASARARAAATVGSLGLRGGPLVSELNEALHDPDHTVRAAAAKALGDIGGTQARVTYATLVELAKDDHESVQVAAPRSRKSACLRRLTWRP